MKIHLKIIAYLYLLLGGFMLVSQISGFYIFFTSSLFRFDSSVLDTSISFFDRLSDNYHRYLEFLAMHDMTGTDALASMIWVVLLFLFGIGLLKMKDWVRKLGYVIIALNIYSFCMAIYYDYLSFAYVIGILFTFYMAVVLSSEKTKHLFANET